MACTDTTTKNQSPYTYACTYNIYKAIIKKSKFVFVSFKPTPKRPVHYIFCILYLFNILTFIVAYFYTIALLSILRLHFLCTASPPLHYALAAALGFVFFSLFFFIYLHIVLFVCFILRFFNDYPVIETECCRITIIITTMKSCTSASHGQEAKETKQNQIDNGSTVTPHDTLLCDL